MSVVKLDESWKDLLETEMKKDYFLKIRSFISEEKKRGVQIFPKNGRFLRAFEETPAKNVKVVILGQDPYHGEGQADGLCFSVNENISFPPSLRNIFLEMSKDLSIDIPKSGSLLKWAKRGVLLLNSCLSVRKESPMSHSKIGWQFFIDRTVDFLFSLDQVIVFICWGSNAQSVLKKHSCDFGNLRKKFLIQSAHPSPFSVHRGFFGSRPFSRANKILKENGSSEIDWTL